MGAWCQWPRGAWVPHAFSAPCSFRPPPPWGACSFALLSFARASGGARASHWAAGCPWGAPWGRGARVEVIGCGSWGRVANGSGGIGPRAFAASCPFALVSFARASGGARALDRAAGCSWGVPWGGYVVIRRRHRLLMKTWTRRKWTLCALRGPIFPPWSALAPRKSRAPFMSRTRGENNERGGAEGGFCAVLGRTHSEICRVFEKSIISDLDLTPKGPCGWFGKLPGAFMF